MNTKTKKGFTLTELIIVVVIIGILAAVLIPTLTACVKKAKISNDKQLVRNLNLALSTDSLANHDGEKHKTMQAALDAAFDAGYDVSKINATKADNEILWDSVNDVFCYLNGDDIEYIPNSITGEGLQANDYRLWKISKTVDAYYSTYYIGAETTIDTSKGFDAPKNTNVTVINYTNSGSAQNVVIRTNGGSLTINAENDTVKHYGYADSVDIQAVKTTSYHEHGRVPFMSMQYGRVVLESSSEVTHIHFERKTESSFDDIIVATANSVELPDFSRDPVTIGAQDILVVEVQSSNSSEFVWLQANGNGTIEDSKVLVSSTKTGEKTAVTEQSAGEHVKQIANTKVGDNVIEGGKTTEQVEAIKEEVVNEYYEKEFVPTDVPANAVAYSYNKDTKVLSSFDTLAQAYASVEEGGSGSFVICKDIDLGNEVFEISNKIITLTGQKDMKPVVRGDIYIHHTSGNHNVQFSNLTFMKGSGSVADNIKDKSICENAEDANKLVIENCKFDSDLDVNLSSKQYSAVAVYFASNNHTGTAFVFRNNEITARSEYQMALCTGVADAALGSLQKTGDQNGLHKPNIVQPIIEGNNIKGSSSKTYGFIGSSALLKNNTFDGIKKAFQVYAVWSGNNGYNGEFNFVVIGNTFKNIPNETFKFYNVDKVTGDDSANVAFEFADDNTFENVSKFAIIGGNSSKFGFEFGLSVHQFAGIVDPSIKYTLASAELTQSGDLVTGYMTLPNGEQVMTYTQTIAPLSGRTGLYYDISNTRLWYFASKTSTDHYFVDNENNVYSVRLTPGDKNITLANMTFMNEIEPESLVGLDGKIYNANFSISTLDGNTLYNATATCVGNKVTVTAMAGKEATDINLFISNNNGKSKVLITSNEGSSADDDTMIYVVPSGTAQINTYGAWNVTIDTDLVNYTTYNQQSITVNEGKNVTGTLLIDGAAAIGSSVNNAGSITRLYIYARTDVTNDGHIGLLRFTRIGGSTILATTTVINAQNSTLINNGTINSIESFTKINVTNASTGTIGRLWLQALDYCEEYAVDSVIVNNGLMCAGKGQNLDLYVRCTFTNNGTIGAEGRGTEGQHDEASCDNYGGMILLGYYGVSSAHNGLVFVNNGTIYAGARHNGTSHQQVTFWVCGGKGTIVSVTISGTGTIYGNNWKTTFGSPVVVTGITFSNNLGN